MNISLIRDTSISSKNVGDFWIGEGIVHLFDEWAKSTSRDVYFNSMDIYQRYDDDWFLSDNNSDVVVWCGTPHLNDTDLSKNFTSHFHAKLQAEKDKGKVLINAWAGFVCTDYDLNIDRQSKRIASKFGPHIRENYTKFDINIARDAITKRVFDLCDVPSVQLVDCVSFVKDKYNVVKSSSEYNVFTISGKLIDIHNSNAVKFILEFIELSKGTPVVVLAHTRDDFRRLKSIEYKLNGSRIECITQPDSLVKFYSKAGMVASMRVHGSVVAASLGCDLTNIGIDTRSSIIQYMGDFNCGLNNDHLKCPRKADINSLKAADKDIFLSKLNNIVPS